jgi:hypothetical protein
VKGGSLALDAWGCLQLVLGAGLAVWSRSAASLLFIAGAMPIFVIAAWNQARPPRAEVRLLPTTSLPVVAIAVGVAAAAVGLTAGLWLVLVGAEILAFGLIWLGRELWLERRAPR